MTDLEKLNSIRSRCVELLSIAEKRTPGMWDAYQRNEDIGTNYFRVTFADRGSDSLYGYCGEANATFIASCAGAAEAGWRATIAAIDTALSLQQYIGITGSHLNNLVKEILTAWEGLV